MTRRQSTLTRQRPAQRPSKLARASYDFTNLNQYEWNTFGVTSIGREHPVVPLPTSLRDHGSILQTAVSPDGLLLATVSTSGQVKIWQIPLKDFEMADWRLISVLRDCEETAIDEFYCCCWLPLRENGDDLYLAVAGKRKDRNVWNESEEDNQVLPGIIKIFAMTGQVIHRLEGHEEEILYLTPSNDFLLSCSQDGYIIKWDFTDNWQSLSNMTKMTDPEMMMAFSVEVLPGSNGKIALAACDGKMRVFDLHSGVQISSFDLGYSSYFDHFVFVDPSCLGKELHLADGSLNWFILTRGVELLDPTTLEPNAPNSIKLFKFSFNDQNGFELSLLQSISGPSYTANSWLMRMAITGPMAFIPTVNGEVLCIDLNLSTTESFESCMTARLCHHDALEVRHICIHPYLALIFTCADDGMVKIYHQL